MEDSEEDTAPIELTHRLSTMSELKEWETIKQLLKQMAEGL
jgi:hypothetical protein